MLLENTFKIKDLSEDTGVHSSHVHRTRTHDVSLTQSWIDPTDPQTRLSEQNISLQNQLKSYIMLL